MATIDEFERLARMWDVSPEKSSQVFTTKTTELKDLMAYCSNLLARVHALLDNIQTIREQLPLTDSSVRQDRIDFLGTLYDDLAKEFRVFDRQIYELLQPSKDLFGELFHLRDAVGNCSTNGLHPLYAKLDLEKARLLGFKQEESRISTEIERADDNSQKSRLLVANQVNVRRLSDQEKEIARIEHEISLVHRPTTYLMLEYVKAVDRTLQAGAKKLASLLEKLEQNKDHADAKADVNAVHRLLHADHDLLH